MDRVREPRAYACSVKQKLNFFWSENFFPMKKYSVKLATLFLITFFSAGILFAQSNSSASLPSGYGKIKTGMTVEEVKSILKEDSQFGYRGERDVSMLPNSDQVLIETDASKVKDSFLDRCWFQFYDGKLYIITININRSKMDHYSVFDALCKKYGDPQSLNPEKSVWRSSSIIMSLEKPLVLRYTDRQVSESLLNKSTVEKSSAEKDRDSFLNGL